MSAQLVTLELASGNEAARPSFLVTAVVKLGDTDRQINLTGGELTVVVTWGLGSAWLSSRVVVLRCSVACVLCHEL